MRYIIHFLITALAIYLFAQSDVVAGISFQNGYVSALIFAVVLGLVNLILGSVLRVLTFPLKILTLGLFSLVVSLIIVYVTDYLVPGVTIVGIVPLIALSVILSITSFFLKLFK